MLNFLIKLFSGKPDQPRLSTDTSPNGQAPGNTVLKYYLYLSQTKVDMLFPQVPADFLKGAEAEIKVNLGLASAALKSRSPEDAKELAGRAAAVCSYIRRHDEVGDVSLPKRWIAGTAMLQWGIVTEYASDIVFFGGKVAEKNLALLGSRESLIGEAKTAEANHAPFYYTLKFFNQIVARNDMGKNVQPPYLSYQKDIEIALQALPKTMTNVEFLAKVLHDEPTCLVATPLYVAIVD